MKNPSSTDNPPTLSGKVIICFIVITAIVVVICAYYYKISEGQRPLKLWGSKHIANMQQSDSTEGWKLKLIEQNENQLVQETNTMSSSSLISDSKETVTLNGREYQIVERHSLDQARGWGNIRRLLLIDYIYEWDEDNKPSSPTWEYAFCYHSDEGTSTVLFSLTDAAVRLEETDTEIKLTEKAVASFRSFLDEQFPPDEKQSEKK